MGVESVRPSRVWFWVVGVVLATAVVLGAVAVQGIVSVRRQVEDLQRVEVPGQAEVAFEEPGRYVVYLEGPGVTDVRETGRVRLRVEPADGRPSPSLEDYEGDLSYNLAGHEGRASATVEIEEAGTYRFRAGESTRGDITNLAVGPSIGRGIAVSVVLLVTALILFLPALLLLPIIGLLRRRSRRALVEGPRPGQPGAWPGPAGWHPDPSRRHEYRFWDGGRWTEHVSDRNARSIDHLGGPGPVQAAGAYPPRAAPGWEPHPQVGAPAPAAWSAGGVDRPPREPGPRHPPA